MLERESSHIYTPDFRWIGTSTAGQTALSVFPAASSGRTSPYMPTHCRPRTPTRFSDFQPVVIFQYFTSIWNLSILRFSCPNSNRFCLPFNPWRGSPSSSLPPASLCPPPSPKHHPNRKAIPRAPSLPQIVAHNSRLPPPRPVYTHRNLFLGPLEPRKAPRVSSPSKLLARIICILSDA